ncbi:thiamine pyrophosphate-binding protein [Streptomyces diastatochromogenes]|uniref:Thiamine pyrophosphate-binding protein n=1 Tax=Streptomyces diastatochromogenes TaxID=42236 RepID=A0A233SCD2_STRDA|nr:thiamine pyrophosphate-binding protein [Streptomyces diastatochromogenes]MCZ0988346.1 thiamine pyrophosphate-binding protein [Streptomyces diastatochromogenes]OXY93320.1 thiamine pyrophosphate-binding protein [Streptomyces diastatochromogenes]
MARQGKAAIIEQFIADGIPFMFGNPGTVEQGFLDELEKYDDLQYILTLQETVAAGIADGYARATGRPALLQLHSGVGLGNAVGMLYQAKRGHSPLLVIAGEAGVKYEAMDAQMAADLVAMADPVTKYATRVTDPGSVLRVLRRAMKIAMTPPCGPVFVALPMDVLDAVTPEPVVPSTFVSTRVAPVPSLVEEAAALLAGAERPVVLVGDGVSASGGQAELVRVAEQLGADVWGVNYSEVNLDARHPLFRGQTGHMFGEVSTDIVREADAVLIVGTYVFPEVFPALHGPFREDARIVHIDLDDYEIAKNHPVTLGLVADPKTTLAALADQLETRLTERDRAAARSRVEERTRQRAEQPAGDGSLLHTFLGELAERVPQDVMIFDEALTASGALGAHLPGRLPGHWFSTRGGSLGVGIPGALGIKLAHPGKTVIGFTGDGGSMYTIQALYTAVRHGIGAKFVICNNRSYKLLDLNIEQYWRERGIPEHAHPTPFDLSHPDLGFVEIARGFGVDAVRVDEPGQVTDAVKRMLQDDRPFLVDLRTAEGADHA